MFRRRCNSCINPATHRLTYSRHYSKIDRSGPVAQLGARFHGMEEVIGSIPIRSTNQPLQNQAYAGRCSLPPSHDFVSFCVTRVEALRRLLTTAPAGADSLGSFRVFAADFLNSELMVD
jgi:hypothetical protein